MAPRVFPLRNSESTLYVFRHLKALTQIIAGKKSGE